MISIKTLSEFMMYFSGNMQAYGIHIYNFVSKGKEQGKNSTKPLPVSEELYKNHLEGKQGLGIIPVSKNKCKFSVLDIDIYDNQDILNNYLNIIYNYNFPLCPFSTKSGGLHLYVFYNDFISAKKARMYMRKFKILLGASKTVEIFPKQDSLSDNRIGNWINLPYYNSENTKQYFINQDRKALLLEDALLEIRNNLQSENTIEEFLEGVPLNDAPPCLQTLYLSGNTDYRNNFLFSLAGYYKIKYGDDFEFKVLEANSIILNKPLSVEEVHKSILSSHKKKDYSYKCNEEPICNYCNKKECKERKYGIGGEEINQLSFEEFIQYLTDPPYYEWKINGSSLKFFSEVDIIQQQKFRVLCFRILHILPYKLKENTWTKIVNKALNNMTIKQIAEDEDISPGMLFKEYLTEFLEKRTFARNKEQILINRVYKDDEQKVYVFKPKNFLDFLIIQKSFRYYGYVEIQSKLRELGGLPKRYYISKEKGSTRVWLFPFKGLTKFLKEDIKIEDFKINFKEDYNESPF
ncbi:MAG: hypothetical protein P8Y70_00190 [Candidatus Lokiarchaeota archaeon]